MMQFAPVGMAIQGYIIIAMVLAYRRYMEGEPSVLALIVGFAVSYVLAVPLAVAFVSLVS